MSKHSDHPLTTLCLVRHGESTWNAERRIQGQLNPPLSKIGQHQAGLVAKRLKQESWSVLYASDLSRAQQTAEAISGQTGLEIVIEARLRERSQGKREGLLADEAREKYPDIHAPEVGRENDEALLSRARSVYETIRDAHLGERVLVVAHGALMRSFLESILEPFDQAIENTSCTLLHWNGEAWECEYLADISHLNGSVIQESAEA